MRCASLIPWTGSPTARISMSPTMADPPGTRSGFQARSGTLRRRTGSSTRPCAAPTAGRGSTALLRAVISGPSSPTCPPARPPSGGLPGPGTITLHGSAAWIFIGGHLFATQTGTSWVQEPAPCGAFGVDSLAAYDTQQVTLLCAGSAGMGSSVKVVYSSRNGGASFTRVGQAPLGGIGGGLAQPDRHRPSAAHCGSPVPSLAAAPQRPASGADGDTDRGEPEDENRGHENRSGSAPIIRLASPR